jgi:hypothetical protein
VLPRGLVLCGFTFVASSLTQLRLYGETMECFPRGTHIRWLNLAIILGILSLLAFDLYQGLSSQPMIPSEGCGLGLLMNLRELMGEDPASIGETLLNQR